MVVFWLLFLPACGFHIVVSISHLPCVRWQHSQEFRGPLTFQEAEAAACATGGAPDELHRPGADRGLRPVHPS